MNLFFELSGYEFKKILCRKRTIIAVTLVIIISALSVFGTIIGNYYYTDENGNEIAVSRYEDAKIERANGEALSGRIIDADFIMEAVEALKNSPVDTDTYDLYYSMNPLSKYREVYSLIEDAFHLGSLDGIRSLTREQAEQFDQKRRENREYVIENSDISENMKAYWKKCLDKYPKSLTYWYKDGYDRFAMIMYTTAIMAGAVIAIMFSGIFSEEYTSGADSLILSSRHGRGLVIVAKLFAAFVISAALIILLTAISFAEAAAVWGAGGADGALELLGDLFPYPITIGNAALIYSLCIFAAVLFFTAITALLSASFKAPFNTIVIMAIILVVPMMVRLPGEAPLWAVCIENLIPTNMMAVWVSFGYAQYEIFGLVIPPYVFLPVFAVIASAVCAFFAYKAFRKHQVS